MLVFWMILAVLRAGAKQRKSTLGWALAVAIVPSLDRYRATGRHRLRWGYETVVARPLRAQAMEPVPRALCWS